MVSIPEPEATAINAIDKYHESKKENFRSHMGCSQLGHHCDRWLWYSFRWAIKPRFPGRVLRIFRRGHHEEEWFVQDLRSVGVDIRSTTNGQEYVDLGCHVGGSLDGIIHEGLPEAPKTKHVAEFKTHGKKSFDDLCKKGVKESKLMHYVQMQLYMQATNIERAYYLAVCKDDDRLYSERIKYDSKIAKKYTERGHRLALSERMPEPISADPSWYQCQFCDAHSMCHDKAPTVEVNCRTCSHSTPKDDSTWRCERWEADGIPYKHQLTGCDDHVFHPDLVPSWNLNMDKSTGLIACWDINGKEIYNGHDAFMSSELAANIDACVTEDEKLMEMRKRFDGRIVG